MRIQARKFETTSPCMQKMCRAMSIILAHLLMIKRSVAPSAFISFSGALHPHRHKASMNQLKCSFHLNFGVRLPFAFFVNGKQQTVIITENIAHCSFSLSVCVCVVNLYGFLYLYVAGNTAITLVQVYEFKTGCNMAQICWDICKCLMRVVLFNVKHFH